MEAKFELLAAAIYDLGYAVMDDFLDAQSCATLLSGMLELKSLGLMRKAGIGRGHDFAHNETVRGDEILWIDDQNDQHLADAFLNPLQALIAYFNRNCFSGIRDYEAHFAAYPPNAFYKRHCDQFKGKGNRRFTFIFYLNADWKASDGGELRMYVPVNEVESIVDITLISGRIVCFFSEMFDHEVLITHANRYSITGWWLDREKGLAFLH